MRVIVSFEGRIRPDSTGFYLVNAFRYLGHDAVHITPDQIMSVNPSDADLFVRCDDGLKGLGWNPSLHPSVYVAIDTHIETDWRLKLVEDGKFDLVTVAQSDGVKLPWASPAIYNPLGCDEKIHSAGKHEKKYDGCFIGNFHNNLAGPRIDMLDEFFRHTPKIFFGNRGPLEFPEIYAQSKLVFNRSINGDVNMRVFEALCSGSCLVSDEIDDMRKIGLISGVHYAGYTDKESLSKVVKELLADDNKRETIAENGRKVSADHTYAKRMKVLIDHFNLNEKETKHACASR